MTVAVNRLKKVLRVYRESIAALRAARVGATLQAAIATLAEHRIGAVVVLGADRRVIGLLSERDVVGAFAEFGADALTKRLAQVMTREVATCGEAESAVSIMERMTTGKFRHISGNRARSAGRHRLDRRHRQTPAVGNGAGVRGVARLYPERIGSVAGT
jgi:CBS domain-containing protein